MERKEFDIFELVRILLQNRKFIIIFVLVISIGAVIYSLVTPKIWGSQASFYMVGQQSSALPFDIPGLGGLASQLMGSDDSQAAVSALTAMRSRSFSEDVIRQFDLARYFKINKADTLWVMDLALRKLKNNIMTIKMSKETGLLTVQAETRDKKLSKDIVDFYLEHLERYNRQQKLTKGKRNREFLEGRVTETRARIDSLIIATKEFQQRHNAIDLQTQTTALIGSYSEVIASKMKVDIELALAQQNFSPTSPIVEELKTRSNALKKQIGELEKGGKELKPQYLIDISKLPDIGSQYAQLKLNQEILTKVFEFIYPQYEAARLEEMRDMPSIDVLDSARETGLRMRPKRAMICILAAGLAFILAVIIVLIKAMLEGSKDRIREIRKSL